MKNGKEEMDNILTDAKEEMKAALKAKGMQPPNEALAKVLGAGQGQGPKQPEGVNLG